VSAAELLDPQSLEKQNKKNFVFFVVKNILPQRATKKNTKDTI